ncbi:MAG: DUF4419 domain-containing protein [Polyangiaceae bacterium]|nr:DUF4419 domain-containing protein [Polyangiaceae bacterium]
MSAFGEGMSTFLVDDVEPAKTPAATIRMAEMAGDCLCLGLPGDLPVLPVRGIHPVVAAAHQAFVDHRALVLTPDAVWITIAQGVAQHARLFPDAFRERWIRHEGRKTLNVDLVGLPTDAEGWSQVVSLFRSAIGENVGQGIARLFTCDFSTTTDVDRAASEIVLMDLMSSYFDYQISVICGIPSVTVTGVPNDWKIIRDRIEVLAELGLDFWVASLRPIADALIAASEGRPDTAFFRRLYKSRQAYGWDRFTGWIGRLFPYIAARGAYTERNPLLDLPIDFELPPTDENDPSVRMGGPGIRNHDVPPGPSRVLVCVRDGTSPVDVLALEGGMLAVEQDPQGRMVPRAGFVLRRAGADARALVERIRAEHQASSMEGDPGWLRDHAELRVLFEEIHDATLFSGDHAWRILAPNQRETITVEREYGDRAIVDYLEFERLVDLPDGMFLGVGRSDNGMVVVLMRAAALGDTVQVTQSALGAENARYARLSSQDASTILVVGKSLIQLLSLALDKQGNVQWPQSETLLDYLPHSWDTGWHARAVIPDLYNHRINRANRGTSSEALADGETNSFDPRDFVLGDIVEGWLFEPQRPWHILPVGARDAISVSPVDPTQRHQGAMVATRIIDLPDQTFLAKVWVQGHARDFIVRMRADAIFTLPDEKPAKKRPRHRTAPRLATSQTPHEIEWVGQTLVGVLRWALDHNGEAPPAQMTLAERAAET